MISPEINEAVLEHHPDLYKRHESGFATMNINNGHIALDSVNAAPFGYGFTLSPDSFLTVKEWIMQGGMAEVV